MNALKDISYKEDEDGELPSLITGNESNLKDILNNTTADGGINIVGESKLNRANKQVEEITLAINNKKNIQQKIPVSIITGYLGSGKSTLLEAIAKKGSDRKIAVILNEFGDSSEIEKSMTIRNGNNNYQEWLDLGNGCLCCSLKNIGVKAIEDMIDRSPGKIDYILLETSGIADPAPIAKMFWQDEGLNSSIYIDGIITVLDCENILKCLDDKSPESHWHGENVIVENNLTIAHFQIAMADRIIMNKFDKIETSDEKIKNIKDKIKEINSLAPIYYTKYGDLGIDKLMDIHAYDGKDISELIDHQDHLHDITSDQHKNESSHPGSHSISYNHKHLNNTFHDPRMNTITIKFQPLKNEFDFKKFEEKFLQVLLWKDFGVNKSIKMLGDHLDWEIQRTKGLILLNDNTVKILQGVRDTYDVFPGTKLPEVSYCKIIFIGKYLDQEVIEKLIYDFLVNICHYDHPMILE
ncbi:hypothetical protein TBLA_0F04100 [Henningerozyma blattae CBS 6284]|uniref:CobW/HypB/UreG nucleotide-binding domain-containing protein n=1 Tax=Henningerozyma blattae (strain ATCC 34711 / CBS 6284 / DSM 70876 / NBRC 10599 / NRRL Y-10934 / UCD 77-7) TaxID=1071380 RepID=I2H6E1_HENB6|nr:hypothetical protein TBLA_0F04100 [Tetrapisispora blattae CBS 6284]CCH61943.1 hypothetical protein TBLA_0F04100 [Tetrapisispora blattae CBS 6284]